MKRAGLGPELILVLLLLGSAPGRAMAQDAAPPAAREGDTVSEYVVQPGDTLERITEKFLGTPAPWPDNWRLNPGLADPQLLRVGQRLRIITHRVLPQRTAEVTKVARRVEEKPHPDPWVSAKVGSVLRERDGIRTYERSSAELAFDDGSRLTLTEDSLVFLREVGSTVSGVRRESLEILEGQADLDSRPRRPRLSDVEIVVGGARLKPEADPARGARARARRAQSGGSQVMVYAGRGEVEAGGAKVALAEGTGSSVPATGPPGPPERLLPAPRLRSPAPRSSWGFANPRFSWGAVAGAVSYGVEVCRDAACAELVLRARDLKEPAWASPGLPRGELFWRATAVSRSGLDGFPAAASPLTIESDSIDEDPPVIAVRLDGPCAPAPNGAVLLGRDARLLIEAHDDASGVAELGIAWDGGSWRTVTRAEVEPPADGKEHLLAARAVDRLGREAPAWSLMMRRALRPPPPPGIIGEPGRSVVR